MVSHDTRPELDLPEYLRIQREEMLSSFNRWITGVHVGHDPSAHECAEHYVEHGGSDEFRRKYRLRPR